MEKVKINLPIIVEGRYDKSALSGFLDATIITTGGFSIFNDKEKQALSDTYLLGWLMKDIKRLEEIQHTSRRQIERYERKRAE